MKPNILLITSDQQHWNTLGFRNPKIKTPNLDRLAREGTCFQRAYCNNPLCSPSRATILTGLYPSSHHCWCIGVKLPEDVPTIGETLRTEGYSTALIGKAHFQPMESTPTQTSIECFPTLRDLDFWRGFHGPWYGFDHIEISRNHSDESVVGEHYAVWMEEQGLKNWRDYFEDWPPSDRPRQKHSWTLPEKFHYSTWTSERTRAAISESCQKNKPFFIWSSFHDPHPPYLTPEPWASMYKPEDMEPGSLCPGEFENMPPHFIKTQIPDADFSEYQETPHWNHGLHNHVTPEPVLRKNMATYYGMISFMDQQIGKILDHLDKLGIAENTLVIFTTDHGHFLGQHGLTTKGPFHYEDLVRLPMLARFPGKIPAGKTNNSLQALIDLPETILECAGIPIPGLMQGQSQWKVWSGEKEKVRDHVIVENRLQPTKVHLKTFITDRYKMTIYQDHDYGEFFDLQEDPGELVNLWNHPSFEKLQSKLLKEFLNSEFHRQSTRHPRIADS